tara:strand:- start:36688 stop:36996 length:309 start_codon:yes stop_codon:yes gene_type:complete
MKSNKKIPKYISDDLSLSQINMLFDLTELQLKWFNMYYPLLNPPFYKLLKSNHRKILHFISVDLMGEYIKIEIDKKFNRMFNAYYSLFEISKHRRKYIRELI